MKTPLKTGPAMRHSRGTMNRVENTVETELDRPNVARVLQQHGYKMGFVRKNHMIYHEIMRRPEKWSSARVVGRGLSTLPPLLW